MEDTSPDEEIHLDDSRPEEDTQAVVAVSYWLATWWRLQKDWYYVTLIWFWLRTRYWTPCTPRQFVLDYINWWQTYITGPEGIMPNRCPRGEGNHCSLRGQLAVERYGALVGCVMVLLIMRQCRRDYDPKGCC